MPVQKLSQSLSQRVYSATQVLENEAKIAHQQNIPMYQLMENAGLAFFSHLQHQFKQVANLLVVCGKGNNGGDGFVIARLADEFGLHVTVYLCAEAEQLKGDAKRAFEYLIEKRITIIYQSEMPLEPHFIAENGYELIVDALFGIGFKGPLTSQYQPIISAINHSVLPVVSVDVPSGLDATTGVVETCAIVAKQTVTFIVLKQGLLTGQAANHVGDIYLADLSLGESFQQDIATNVMVQIGDEHQQLNHVSNNNSAFEAKANTKATTQAVINLNRAASSHKGNIGLLLAVGGGQGYPGAIRLASEAALRTGASLVAVYCHRDNYSMVLNGRPECMLSTSLADKVSDSLHFQKAKVLLCGPGLGRTVWGESLFKQIVLSDKPKVIDADALHFLASNFYRHDHWVLTPHPGEAAALLACSVDEIEKDRFSAVQAIAKKYGGICVLKGAGSLISDGDNVWINTSGNSGMASGGMGDVLSGIIAALLMQLDNPLDAVRWAVYLHGQAANIIAQKYGKIGMLASDLLPIIQQLVNQK